MSAGVTQLEIDLNPPEPIAVAHRHADQFTDEFLAYLPANLHVYEAFEREALRIAGRGRRHYSARTIVEVLRHHSLLAEAGGPWKLNDWHTPYLARLFALMNREHADLFEFREAKAAARDRLKEAA